MMASFEHFGIFSIYFKGLIYLNKAKDFGSYLYNSIKNAIFNDQLLIRYLCIIVCVKVYYKTFTTNC